MINSVQKKVLELIGASLFGKTYSLLDNMNWDLVRQEAEAQTVSGIVATVVPYEVAGYWDEIRLRCKANYLRVLHGQSQLVQLFAEAGIPLVILKGAAAAIYYPAPYSRMFGDVDILVPQAQFEKAARLMEVNGYQTRYDLKGLSQGYKPRHIEFFLGGIEYELHHHFSTIGIDIEQYLIDGLVRAKTAKIGNFSFPVLPPMENGLLILAHARFHLQSAELGLRQVVDWMMFVHHELDDEKWEKKFSVMAEKVGLKKLAVTLTRLCRDYIGLPGTYSWCEEADKKTVDALLQFIFDRGNFGRKVDHHYNVEIITAQARSRGFLNYLNQYCTALWANEKVQRHHYMVRPVIFIKLVGKWLRTRMKESGRDVFNDLRTGNELSKLYKELGLD